MNLKVLFIDNRDSFAYNVVELLRQLGVGLDVIVDGGDGMMPQGGNVLTDGVLTAIESGDADGLRCVLGEYDGIVLSPGAGVPGEYRIMQGILTCRTTTPILGICLGHQAIAECGGGRLVCMERPYHGHRSQLMIDAVQHPLFKGIGNMTAIGRYHSWCIDPASVEGSDIEVLARDEDGNIQVIALRSLPYIGLQFHPESIITAEGREIMANWLSCIRKNG